MSELERKKLAYEYVVDFQSLTNEINGLTISHLVPFFLPLVPFSLYLSTFSTFLAFSTFHCL